MCCPDAKSTPFLLRTTLHTNHVSTIESCESEIDRCGSILTRSSTLSTVGISYSRLDLTPQRYSTCRALYGFADNADVADATLVVVAA